jgi:hypothetical protein
VSSLSSGGGGDSAIYKDGTAVNERLNSGETLTIPAGETYVITVQMVPSGQTTGFAVNGNRILNDGGTENLSLEVVVSGGDTISEHANNGGAVGLTGWSV